MDGCRFYFVYNFKDMVQDIVNNKERSQFEYHEEGEIARLEYRFKNADMVLMHTEVPKVLEGRGIASRLAKFAFEQAKQQQRKVLVYCPYISSYLRRHPEYDELVEKDYNK